MCVLSFILSLLRSYLHRGSILRATSYNMQCKDEISASMLLVAIISGMKSLLFSMVKKNALSTLKFQGKSLKNEVTKIYRVWS